MPKQVTQQLRAALWSVIYESLQSYRSTGDSRVLIGAWDRILKDLWVFHLHRMVDDYSRNFQWNVAYLKIVFETGNYVAIFGVLEFILRHPAVIPKLAERVESALEHCRAAYKLVDGDTFILVGTPEEAESILRALDGLSEANMTSARGHLVAAGSFLTNGQFSDSVRESVHAVESAARTLDPKAASGLAPALARLEAKSKIHSALKSGFSSIYGYTSDAGGIRHALIGEGKAAVDMHDALFMIGACASFITYLLGKAQDAGLLAQDAG